MKLVIGAFRLQDLTLKSTHRSIPAYEMLASTSRAFRPEDFSRLLLDDLLPPCYKGSSGLYTWANYTCYFVLGIECQPFKLPFVLRGLFAYRSPNQHKTRSIIAVIRVQKQWRWSHLPRRETRSMLRRRSLRPRRCLFTRGITWSSLRE